MHKKLVFPFLAATRRLYPVLADVMYISYTHYDFILFIIIMMLTDNIKLCTSCCQLHLLICLNTHVSTVHFHVTMYLFHIIIIKVRLHLADECVCKCICGKNTQSDDGSLGRDNVIQSFCSNIALQYNCLLLPRVKNKCT